MFRLVLTRFVVLGHDLSRHTQTGWAEAGVWLGGMNELLPHKSSQVILAHELQPIHD